MTFVGFIAANLIGILAGSLLAQVPIIRKPLFAFFDWANEKLGNPADRFLDWFDHL